MIGTRGIRVHVRNKSRYNPETEERKFLYVEINDFAGTTIGDIKEDVRRQSRGALRIDELFLDNQSLADDRSVAHYNLEDGCILETASNPFWVACLYIKASEIKQEMEGNPNDKHIQEWTQKSLPKKYTLIGLLLNSKKEYDRQPPHFSTLDEFAIYLERLNKKGATMHPEYTQKDMRAFEREFRQEFLGRYLDPIAAFIDHHAVRLGHALPDEIEQRPLHGPNIIPRNVRNALGTPAPAKAKPGGRKKQARYCDDCEEALAEVYCTECQGGLAMCRRCSNILHAGASRRRHNLQDIEQAPSNNSKPYVPRAFLAPFSIVLAMYNALTQSMLSMTEDEIKRRAQPLTDTDLQDKQAGKYVGGFDCMENVLMDKGLVKKEAARIPTYALSASGQVLGQRLYVFYTQFYRFMESCRIPKVHNSVRNGILNNRKLCLIVDENERDKQRLLMYAAEKNIDAQVRLLPAGDYIWIVTPPMIDPNAKYTGKDYGNELVLPFVVERKSWEDFENSTNSGRFKRQINNMLGCGLANCFYLMEGSQSGLRNNPTQHHQQYLKGLLEKLVTENGFYVNYTSSWMKSAQWLLWFTGFLINGWRTGVFQDLCISYQEYMSRVARQRGNTGVNSTFRNARRHTHTWKAQLFVDHIIRDSHGERGMMSTIREDLGVTNRIDKHLLVIQNLEQYNKKRQSALNKCCEAVFADPGQAKDIVEDKLGPVIHNMLHYDISSYWQLYMQVMAGVYVVRTETDQDTEKIHRIFLSTTTGTTPTLTVETAVPKATNRRSTNQRKSSKTATISTPGGLFSTPNDPLLPGPHHLPRRRNPSDHLVRELSSDVYDGDLSVHRNTGIHSILPEQSSISSPFHHVGEETEEERHFTAGHVLKKGSKKAENDNEHIGKKAVEVHMIQPFSGQGYCLGSGSYYNNSGTEKAGNSIGKTLQNQIGKPDDFDRYQPGLVGGMWNSRNNSVDEGGTWNSSSDDKGVVIEGDSNKDVDAVHSTDFVDSQNEEDIMKEILERSVAEVKQTSNEDEIMKLALEMSKQTSVRKANSIVGNDSTEDAQLFLALEMSNIQGKGEGFSNQLSGESDLSTVKGKEDSNYKDKNNVMNLSEEEQLKHVLEMSKLQSERNKKKADSKPLNRTELDPNRNEEAMVKLAVEMSMKETGSIEGRIKEAVGSNMDEDGAIVVIPDNEEEQMKLALEISKKHTPKKLEKVNAGGNACGHRIHLKRKNTDSGLLLSEEDQLKMALELSMSQTVKEDVHIGTPGNRRASEKFDKNMISSRKLNLTGEGNIGVSPCKKSKHDQNYNEVNRNTLRDIDRILDDPPEAIKRIEGSGRQVIDKENEDLKIAIERSKVEHSPAKKVRLGRLLLDEDEVMNIVIERSKVEHSPLMKVESSYVKAKKEEVTLCASSIEVIEISSQNSQEMSSDSATLKEDIYSSNSADDTDSGDTGDSSCIVSGEKRVNSNKHSTCTENRYTEASCSDKTEKSISWVTLATEKDADFGNCDVADENNDEDDDFIPPSPEKTFSLENISFSQTFFSKTPENVSHQSAVRSSSDSRKDRPSGYTQPDSTSVQSSGSGLKCSESKSEFESSGKSENETSEALNDKERLKKPDDDNKFDIKASLFYDTDDSGSESEADIFHGDEDIETKREAAIGAEDNEVSVALERKQLGQVFTEVSEEKQIEDETMVGNIDSPEIGERVHVSNSERSNSINIDKLSNTKVDFQNYEADFEPQDNYADYDDDDDNDIDYQPDSQDFNVEDECDSRDSNSDSDIEENSQEKNDDELLPLIRRPRNIRYRELKEESERLYKLKKQEKEMENLKNEIKIKTEVNDEVESDNMSADEMYARKVQEQLNREREEEKEKRLLIDDAYIARQLHETLNKEPAPGNNESEGEIHLRLQSDVGSSGNNCILEKERRNTAEPVVDHPSSRLSSSGNISTKGRSVRDLRDIQGSSDNNTPAVIRELQRRELEKIERWRRMLMEDEKLAQRLQEMQDDKEETESISVESQRKSLPSQHAETSFKKMVAQHKASKEKAMAQLQQYRNLQMKRFQEVQNRSQNTSTNTGGYTNFDQDSDVIVVTDNGDIEGTQYNNTRPEITAPINRTQLTENRHFPAIGSLYSTNAVSQIIQPMNTGHMTQNTQSQSSRGSHFPQLIQSQSVEGDHVMQSIQSQSATIKYSNVTCGNCGEKGHNRTFPKCPKYHTAEESARREAKLEKQRQQKEEKRKQEVETVHMLSEHKRILEDMTSQIQREMGTIQNRLQQRTSELEAQVTQRVKKIENAGKKKKR